ncbi:MAG: chromate transporter [Steroidobacteraceae bacterium]
MNSEPLPAPTSQTEPCVPHEPLLELFFRFLRFGCLAWGGPVAQIGMIRQELVEEERWISREQFNRVLAVYQVLPGPEAHELCVYFGMLARGRLGGLLAGAGFMLPGLVLVLVLSWAYLRFGLQSAAVAPIFGAMQVAVAALIVRAVFRIGRHALGKRWLIVIALMSAAATLALGSADSLLMQTQGSRELQQPSAIGLLAAGLKAGLLTFGGAYTAIPLLQHDAVLSSHAWMSHAQFLDGVALSGLLPAPLIIFATFVGYVGGGLVGALLMTAGVFVPAFAFTLVGHRFFERLLSTPRVRVVLDGVMAAVVGLIAATAVGIVRSAVTDVDAALLFGLVLAVLFATSSRWVIPAVIAGSAVWGAIGAFPLSL